MNGLKVLVAFLITVVMAGTVYLVAVFVHNMPEYDFASSADSDDISVVEVSDEEEADEVEDDDEDGGWDDEDYIKAMYVEEEIYDSESGCIVNGHKYVTVGGVKWAAVNVGSANSLSCGLLFDQNSTMVDKALEAWGKGWRLPTMDEFYALYDSCVWQPFKVEDYFFYEVSDNADSDNSIYLPVALGDFGCFLCDTPTGTTIIQFSPMEDAVLSDEDKGYCSIRLVAD